jgi:transcriptional regulator with XRE-family HTH domain
MLGGRLARFRLANNITQQALAERAGISKSTLKRLEAGQNASLDTLIRLMQALDLGGRLESLVPDSGMRPMERLDTGGRERQRARPVQRPDPAERPWKWGDEK